MTDEEGNSDIIIGSYVKQPTVIRPCHETYRACISSSSASNYHLNGNTTDEHREVFSVQCKQKRGKNDLVYSIKMEIVRRGRELREKDFHKQHEADRPVFNSRILFKSDSKIITFLYENEKK